MLYDSPGKYAEAEPLSKRALAIWEKALGPNHPETATSLTNLSGLQVVLGRYPESAALTDRARRGTRRHVCRVLPSLSAGWLANGKAVGQEAASQQIILAWQSQNPAAKAAVASLEQVRADLAKLAQMTPSPEQAAAYRGQLTGLQADEQRLVHEIGGQLAALDRDEPWVELDAIRRNIPTGSVLVDIARFDIFKAKGKERKWQPARYAAWIVPPAGKGDATILDLGPAEEIDAAVAAYRDAIKAVEGGVFKRGQATAEHELKITAAPLTQKVLQPILDTTGSATDIVLSPDGALWLVPWQALPLADGSYAIEKYSIRTVKSGRDALAGARHRERPDHAELLMRTSPRARRRRGRSARRSWHS